MATSLGRWLGSASQGRLALPLFGAVLLAYLGWQLLPTHLAVFAYDYDEGVYLQTAWAVQRGFALYTQVWTSQPPLLAYLLAGFFQVAGHSVMLARVLMILLSLAGLLGVGLLAGRARGWPAALGAVSLLALSPSR